MRIAVSMNEKAMPGASPGFCVAWTGGKFFSRARIKPRMGRIIRVQGKRTEQPGGRDTRRAETVRATAEGTIHRENPEMQQMFYGRTLQQKHSHAEHQVLCEDRIPCADTGAAPRAMALWGLLFHFSRYRCRGRQCGRFCRRCPQWGGSAYGRRSCGSPPRAPRGSW